MKATITRLCKAVQVHYHLTDAELILAFENGADSLDITDDEHIAFWHENINDIAQYTTGDSTEQEMEFEEWYTILLDYGTDCRKCIDGIVDSWYVIECVGSWLSEVEDAVDFNSRGQRMVNGSISSPVCLRLYIHIIKNGRTDWSDRRRYEAWDSIELY